MKNFRRGWMSAAAILLSLTGALNAQNALRVDGDAATGGDGTSWATAYTDLQDALDAAALDSTVTEIWVAEGTYTPGPAGARNSTFSLADGLTLYGGFAGTESMVSQRSVVNRITVLSGDLDQNDTFGSQNWDGAGWSGYDLNAFHVVTGNGVGASAVIDGFQIIGGSSASGGIPVPFGNFGGGIFLLNASPTILNCTIRRNTAAEASGAGLFLQNGSPTIESCVFEENRSFQGQGGGIYFSGVGTPIVRDSDFNANRSVGGSNSGGGAGLFIASSTPTTIERCSFVKNIAENFHIVGDPFGSFGGGIYNFADGTTIRDCEFIDNDAHAGGGIYTWGDFVTITNCVFRDNLVQSYEIDAQSAAGGGGGGVAAQALTPRTTTITQCTFARNTAGEGGGAMTYGEQAFVVRNSIFFENTATGFEVSVRQAQIKGDLDIAHCCIEGLFQPQQPGDPAPNPGQYPGSTEANPLFVDLLCGDLRLSPGSPCLDSGDNGAVPAGVTTDLLGDPRFIDDPSVPDTGVGTAPIVDMGAYEVSATPVGTPEFVRGDANRSGSINLADPVFMLSYLFAGGSADCLSALDANDSGVVSISDAVYVLFHLFQGGAPMAAPFPGCGIDPTPDALDCNTCLPCS